MIVAPITLLKYPDSLYGSSVRIPSADIMVFGGNFPWYDVAGPRLEYWVGSKPYSYGRGPGTRTYEPCESLPVFDEIMKNMNIKEGTDYNCYFINGYRGQYDSLGWHSDDSPEMDGDHPISIFTFGAERYIHFRRKGLKGPAEDKCLLTHMSMLTMKSGMQYDWNHKIPKHSEPCNARVSVTYRRLV